MDKNTTTSLESLTRELAESKAREQRLKDRLFKAESYLNQRYQETVGELKNQQKKAMKTKDYKYSPWSEYEYRAYQDEKFATISKRIDFTNKKHNDFMIFLSK